jgi:hypothetical protein
MTMQKVLWCCCAAVVAAAACVYMTAKYVERNPGCMPAQCVQAAWCVATEWNPMMQVGRVVGARTVAMMKQIKGKSDCCMKPKASSCAAPADEAPCKPSPVEPIDLSGCYIQHRQQYIPPSDEVQQTGDSEEAETVPPCPIVEAEPAPAEMPPCEDDDAVQVSEQGPFDDLLNLVREELEAAVKDTEELPMPHEEAAEEQCKDDFEKFLDGILEPVQSVEEQEPEVLPMPHEEEDAPAGSGSAEESDTVPMGTASDCQESPDVNQRYPGCPNMGSCTRTQNCPVPQTAPPTTPEEKVEPGESEGPA